MPIVCGKRGLAVVTLLCHLLTTFGFPLSATVRKTGTTPFPCQSRPCGCGTAEEGWKGDCCCFTLEEKLRWAEAHGVEPPPHVRPLVEARKSPPAPPVKKKQRGCAECDPRPAPASASPKRPQGTTRTVECCTSKPISAKRTTEPSGVKWVAGMYAQRCKGQGPADRWHIDPFFVPQEFPDFAEPTGRDQHPRPRSDHAEVVAQLPLIPPPRPSRSF
jgi:hypothetical protein